jgi:UDP-N-acetylmuramate: L-alanyl-gamma-D-glutamyl-meso-diaminopimelate ligase
MKAAQTQVVYFNPDKVKDKNLEAISEADVRSAFAASAMKVFTNASELQAFLEQQTWKNKNLLMMSSGNFGGINIPALSEKILS